VELKKGADVFSSTGEKIGSLDRVVLNPETKEVTHIVVEKGVVFTINKVIPIEYVNMEAGYRIALDRTAQDLEDLPSYDPASYINLDRTEYPEENHDIESVYWYPPVNIAWWTTGLPMWYPKPQYVKAEKVIPDDTIALEEGAKVFSKDGEHIGDVEEVIIEPDEHRATHIVVGEGFFLKEHKLVPTLWITSVDEDMVNLSVWSDLFDKLPEYESSVA
jgi:uncharacterized protein YrrD